MKKLNLAELKEMSTKVNALKNLDAIKGGTMSGCHKQKEGSIIKVVKPGDVRNQ